MFNVALQAPVTVGAGSEVNSIEVNSIEFSIINSKSRDQYHQLIISIIHQKFHTPNQ